LDGDKLKGKAMFWLTLIFLVIWLVCGGIGSYVAGEKRRSGAEGFWLGFLLGPLGILIEAMLPTITPKPVAKKRAIRRSSGWQPPKEDDPMETEVFGYLTEKKTGLRV
jgi:hypothetical protein